MFGHWAGWDSVFNRPACCLTMNAALQVFVYIKGMIARGWSKRMESLDR
jgi:hypothetical protein